MGSDLRDSEVSLSVLLQLVTNSVVKTSQFTNVATRVVMYPGKRAYFPDKGKYWENWKYKISN